jgi:hypothetical protein
LIPFSKGRVNASCGTTRQVSAGVHEIPRLAPRTDPIPKASSSPILGKYRSAPTENGGSVTLLWIIIVALAVIGVLALLFRGRGARRY